MEKKESGGENVADRSYYPPTMKRVPEIDLMKALAIIAVDIYFFAPLGIDRLKNPERIRQYLLH